MSENPLQKAIDAATEATSADDKGEYAVALSKYIHAIDLFQHYLKYGPKTDNINKTITQKCSQYLDRAEELKKYIESKKNREVLASETSGKTKNDDTDDGKRLKNQLKSSIVMEKPNVRLEDVAGLEPAKRALNEAVVLPLKFPDLFTGNRRPWRGILLFGPPGTGKSHIAKAVASMNENTTFISVSSSDLVCKWLGESEKLVKNLFDLAREHKPSIIFIDEIDSLCSSRNENESESARRIKTEFLVQMDGIRSGQSNEGVLVLGATNMPWVLDSGIRRRFEKRIYIPLPEESARAVLFRNHIGSTPNSLTQTDYLQLAKLTAGYSGADIGVVVHEALMEPIRVFQNATHFKLIQGATRKDPKVIVNDLVTPCPPGDPAGFEQNWLKVDQDKLYLPPVTNRDVLKALSNIRPTVSKDECVKLQQFCDEYGIEG